MLPRWLQLAFMLPVSVQSYGADYGNNRDALNPTGFYAASPRTNIPAPKVQHTSNKTGLQSVVDLAVGHFDLQNGSFTFAGSP